jgi:hypothetical protein
MARLPPSGAAIATPFQVTPTPRVLTELDLREVLMGLCPGGVFTQTDVAAIYLNLRRILGRWHSGQGRPDTASLATDLAKLGENLESVATHLSSIEHGLHHVHDVELVSKLVNVLSAEGGRSSREAHDLIASFRRDALKISIACCKGAAGFKGHEGKNGRPKLGWYDDFKTLLFEIARLGGIEPRLGKDRITEERTGWLIEAAQKLETFLDPAMRSSDVEACGKRLERAKVARR